MKNQYGRDAKPHTVELTELQDFLNTHETVFASSTRERKRLLIDLRGNFKVYVAHQLIHEGIIPNAAIEAYNSITEKYIDPDAERLKNFKL